tara:strand:- start:185 stop:355 length:171 start_codon:yes stop_codon:yes gene_type:complete
MVKAVDKKVGGAIKDRPIAAGDHPPCPPVDNRTITIEQEPFILSKKHIEETRQLLT